MRGGAPGVDTDLDSPAAPAESMVKQENAGVCVLLFVACSQAVCDPKLSAQIS